jgi:hypothetical protein
MRDFIHHLYRVALNIILLTDVFHGENENDFTALMSFATLIQISYEAIVDNIPSSTRGCN